MTREAVRGQIVLPHTGEVRMRIKLLGLACGIAALASCAESTAPREPTDLTTQQTAALAVTLLSNGALDSEAAIVVPFALSQLHEAGTIGEYSAVGVQVNYNYTIGTETHSGVISSIVGWRGLDASTQKLIIATQKSNSSTFPTSSKVTFDNDAGIGLHFDRATGSSYSATSGDFNLPAAAFGAGTMPCSPTQAYNGVLPATCNYTTGTMTGDFGFTASRATGTGAPTFTQPSTPFEIPAVRVTVSFTCACYPDE